MTEQSTFYISDIGNKIWYLPSKGKNCWHRGGGPAIEYTNGDNHWYLNDRRHREDGPAVEWKDGSKAWWVNGRLHRTDGPAIEWPDGRIEWWINGNELPTEEIEEWLKENKMDLQMPEGQMAFKLRWL